MNYQPFLGLISSAKLQLVSNTVKKLPNICQTQKLTIFFQKYKKILCVFYHKLLLFNRIDNTAANNPCLQVNNRRLPRRRR